MNRIKILMLMSLIPLVLRGASLFGDVIPSPHEPPSISNKNDASVGVEASQVDHRSRLSGFGQRRFGGDGVLFRDDKRFSPTGSNPLHNL
ncbi:hypothetical protein ACP70R_040824 [Stipagrostis hirtigluma subsp. patula]